MQKSKKKISSTKPKVTVMNKQILSCILTVALVTTPSTKPVSPAVTAVTCGVIGAAVVGLWNLDLSPKAPVSKNKPTIQEKTSFALLVQKHKEKIIAITRIVAAGAALALIGYKAHPIIASIFKIMPRLPRVPAQQDLDFFGYKTVDDVEKNWDDFKSKYKKEALKWHPDKNKSKEAQEMFRELAKHYKAISEYHVAKEQYDKKMSENK